MEPTEHFGIYFGYIRRLFQRWVSPFKPLLPALGSGLGSLAWPEARLASAPDRCSAWLRARFSAQDTRTRLDFARGSSRFAPGPVQLESLLIIGRGSGSVRLCSIRYLGLSSSRLLARARLGTRLGTRESAQCSARPKSELGLGSDLGPTHQLGTRDSTWFDLGLRHAHLTRFGAWDRALTWFGLEARPGSKLRARAGSGLGARLGSESGSAHLGSENIISETKPERRKYKTKTFRRESAKVRRWKQTKNANENITRKKWSNQRLPTSLFSNRTAPEGGTQR